MAILTPILIGLVGGILSGLLGIGGGAIFVIAMVFLLGVGQFEAQGISLAVIVITAMVGAATHARAGHVEGKSVAWIALPAMAAAVAGATVAGRLEGDALRRVFGVIILFISIQMFATSFRRKTPPPIAE